MKKIILTAGIIFGFLACKQADGIYEEYIVPNGLFYPGKVLDAEALSGKERVEITWKNSADPKVVKARISWNNNTKSIEVDVNSETETFSQIIEPLEENDYSFVIRTYDDKGNVSVPVEVMGTAYGEMYERSLTNRTFKNAIYDFDQEILQIEWSAANAAEIGIELYYTDVDNKSRTVEIDPSKTAWTVEDFKVGEPVFYATMYRPDSTAIDDFHAQKVKIPYIADITGQVLKNPGPSFINGALVHNSRFYLAADWKTNTAAAVNGNVDAVLYNQLCFLTVSGYTPVPSIENAKLYQTVELEAGIYEFEVIYAGSTPGNYTSGIAYIAAAWGKDSPKDLPDIESIGQDVSSSFVLLPNTYSWNTTRKVPVSLFFEISEKSFVNIGFVASLSGSSNLQIYFDSVKLRRYF